MARSTNVYVIVNKYGDATQGFTVKHELITHLKRFPDSVKDRTIYRLSDGNHGPVHCWPASEFLALN